MRTREHDRSRVAYLRALVLVLALALPGCQQPCPDGQQYNQTPDGKMVCGPACGPDQIATADGSCRCVRVGATLDPATGTCGCPAGQVDISQPGAAGMQCAAACPAGQQYNQTPDGKMVCGPACGPDQIATADGSCRCVGEGLVVDPATGLCLNPCSEGQELNADGFCDTIKQL